MDKVSTHTYVRLVALHLGPTYLVRLLTVLRTRIKFNKRLTSLVKSYDAVIDNNKEDKSSEDILAESGGFPAVSSPEFP